MTQLAQRKTRLVFETSSEVRSRGKYRQVIFAAEPYAAYVRLKGTKQRLPITYAQIYDLAAKLEANRVRAEKKAARDARKGGR